MHYQATQETGPTLPPILSLLDGLMAKSPSPETLGARIARLRPGNDVIRLPQIEQLP